MVERAENKQHIITIPSYFSWWKAAANLQWVIKSPSVKPIILANGIQRALGTVGPFWNAKMNIVARLPDREFDPVVASK